MIELLQYADQEDKTNKGEKKWSKACHRHMQEERDKLFNKNKTKLSLDNNIK